MNIKWFALIGLFLVLFTHISCEPEVVEKDTKDFSDRVKLALRNAGNELLLAQQDSTSLVLPVLEIADKQYELSFEQSLTIVPDSLVTFIEHSFKLAGLPGDYRLSVVKCKQKEISYSFEMSTDPSQRMLPCAQRVLPEHCYVIDVLFLDPIAVRKTGIASVPPYVFFLLACIPLAVVVYNKRKKVEEEEVTTNEFLSLGILQFYTEQHKIVHDQTEIALSNKECELLTIFVDQLNQVVKREDLSKRVWEDHGVVVGRSLDTYVSKLRKKLLVDPNIKLTNVHGVGYKLEVAS
jgi:hypothetical protein